MKKIREITTIGIFGFGNMGQAIFTLLKKEAGLEFIVYSIGINKINGAKCVASTQELVDQSDIVFLCIKPQDFYEVSKVKIKNKNIIIVSIMAGVRIENIRKIIPTKKIIRAMPNLPLQVGKAVIGWNANKKYFSTFEIKKVENMLAKFGKTFYFENESMLNSVTAISGSGPAYVFLFINALEKSAQQMGFDYKTAREIAIGTIEGSLAYLQNEKNIDLEKLIEKVKSKKGTTEAALNSINTHKYYSLWQRATEKAKKRSEELSAYEIK